MPIRVAHVVRQYHPSVGGMEDVVRNISAYSAAREQQPVVITLDRVFRNAANALPHEDMVDGVPVVRLPYVGSERYPLCPQVLRYVRDADVVHVHGVDFFFDYLAATKAIHRRPLVASTHGGFFHTRFASKLKQIYFRTVTRTSSLAYDRIIATSANDGDIFRRIVPGDRLSVIENGVNVEKYRDKGSRQLVPTLIYFGRWSANKGIVEALDFLAALRARDGAWRLIIAGREYDHTVDTLSAAIAQRDLADAVELAPNPTDAELSALIGRASYFICLSRHEGFGIAPIEAMSAGLIPVLSDIPPFRSLVEQSGQGIVLAAGGDVSPLLTLHGRGDFDHLLRRRNTQRFVERYSWSAVADGYVDVYEELAGAR
ncbi:glycosyltransferase family 4 protein [Uliginosibacterium sp. sgz301328]|uniref:glycosyltransferase family 4 protein n=1 Tax=Uliginosibacterium sp. sgz301328 TaxID=3243764 RepID=UPI00359DE32A